MKKIALLLAIIAVSGALQAANPINDPAVSGANSPFLNGQNNPNLNANQLPPGQNPNLRDGAMQGSNPNSTYYQNDYRYQSGQMQQAPSNYPQGNMNSNRNNLPNRNSDLPTNGYERQVGYPGESGYTDFSDPNAPSHVR